MVVYVGFLFVYHRAIVMVLFQLLKLSARKNCGGKHVYFLYLII